MSDKRSLEPMVIDTIEKYFQYLQSHATAEVMLAGILTHDFETGFVGGHMWRGHSGLVEFIESRSVFFDESHEIIQILDVAQVSESMISARTRLKFFLRRVLTGAARSEEFTGEAFHTWRFACVGASSWRVDAQLVDGFAALNENAAALFAVPSEGLHT